MVRASPPVTLDAVGPEGTIAVAGHLGAVLRTSGVDEFLIDLRGELGTGKTVFVRGLARALGVAPSIRVVSPTFTIARAYALDALPLRVLHHVDAYRLRDAADLDGAGFEEMCGTGCLTCVEWGELVEEALPVDRLQVTLTAQADPRGGRPDRDAGLRTLVLVARGPGACLLLEGLRERLGRPEATEA